jgi:hypothetical protein
VPFFDPRRTQEQLRRAYFRGLRQAEPYWNFGYPTLTNHIPDLSYGTVLVAANENQGKSQFVLNLGYNVLRFNPEAYWIDFSLDDGELKRISYLLARTGEIPIGWINRAGGLSEQDQQRRHDAFSSFNEQYNSRYSLFANGGSGTGQTRFSAEWITARVAEARKEIDELDAARWERENIAASDRQPSKLFVTIDGFHNIDLEARSHDENDRQRQKSQLLQHSAYAQRCLYMMTAQVNKDSRARGLTADVVRGDMGPIYDAEVVIRLFCDLTTNRDKADLYWVDASTGEKLPVNECDIRKNKSGGFIGTVFYNYIPWRCWFDEPDAETQSYYHELAFSSRER